VAKLEERAMSAREPIFNVPGTVVAVLALLAAIHGVRALLPPDDDAWLVYALAFVPARYQGLADELPGGETAVVTSFVTHMLVHGSLAHLIFNSAWLLAFGAAIAERIGGLRFLAFATFCGVSGALTFLVFNPGLAAPMIGASGAVSGLMGGTMRFLFSAIDQGGLRRLREAPRSVPLMSLRETLADRRVQLTTALWLFLNVLANFGFGGVDAPGGIAWEAHVGGYVVGLLTFGFFDLPAAAHSSSQPAGD
jgi:membrane associated rhomboid family serine protease